MLLFQSHLSKTKCLPALLLLVFLTGCIRDVNIMENQQEQLLVLNSILDASDDTLQVNLSWSKPVQAAHSFIEVKAAQIRLFEVGQFIGEFTWIDSSLYMLPYRVIPGKVYRIEASAEGTSVWAETTVPNLVNASLEKATPWNYMDPFLVTLNDKEDEDNYYWISATGNEGSSDSPSTNIACSVLSNYEYADNFNQVVSQNSVYYFEYDYYLRFNDKGISSNTVGIEFSPQCIGYPKKVFLLSADTHLDRYMKSSLFLHEMNLYAEDMPIIYAPFPVYSNIHNGTGIFGSFSSVSKEFFREQE